MSEYRTVKSEIVSKGKDSSTNSVKEAQCKLASKALSSVRSRVHNEMSRATYGLRQHLKYCTFEKLKDE